MSAKDRKKPKDHRKTNTNTPQKSIFGACLYRMFLPMICLIETEEAKSADVQLPGFFEGDIIDGFRYDYEAKGNCDAEVESIFKDAITHQKIASHEDVYFLTFGLDPRELVSYPSFGSGQDTSGACSFDTSALDGVDISNYCAQGSKGDITTINDASISSVNFQDSNGNPQGLLNQCSPISDAISYQSKNQDLGEQKNLKFWLRMNYDTTTYTTLYNFAEFTLSPDVGCYFEVHIHKPDDGTVTLLGMQANQITSNLNTDQIGIFYKANENPLPSGSDCPNCNNAIVVLNVQTSARDFRYGQANSITAAPPHSTETQGCSIRYECTVASSPSGYAGDMCASQGNSAAIWFETTNGRWNFTTNDKIRYPPGAYIIEIKGTIDASQSSQTKTLNVVLIDPCAEDDLTINVEDQNAFEQNGEIYFDRNIYLLKENTAGSAFSTSKGEQCPIVEYSCQIQNSRGSYQPCNHNKQSSSETDIQINFDAQLVQLSFKASWLYDGSFRPGQNYPVRITAYAGTTKQVTNTIETELKLHCMIGNAQASAWYSKTSFDIIRRDYLQAGWSYSQQADQQPVTPISDSAYACQIVQPITWRYEMKIDGGSLQQCEENASTSCFPLVLDQAIGTSQEFIIKTDFANKAIKATSTLERRTINYIDGYTRLEIDEYQQKPVTIDLTSGLDIQKITPPLFKDHIEDTIQLYNGVDTPQMKISFKIEGHESEDIDNYVRISYDDYYQFGQSSQVQFQKVSTCPLETLNLVVCFSYGDYENLSDLCDTENALSVINSLGSCFTEFEVEIDQTIVSQPEGNTITKQLHEESSIIVDLATITSSISECGQLGFRLANETQENIIELTEEGVVSLKSVTDSAWLGSHIVSFEVYRRDLDPSALYSQPLKLAIAIQIIEGDSDIEVNYAISDLNMQAPISLGELKPVYYHQYGKIEQETFYFADPLALEIEKFGVSESGQKPFGLEVQIIANEIPYVTLKKSTGEERGLGFRAITFQVDGISALKEYEDYRSSNFCTNITGLITIQVSDVSPEGKSTIFAFNYTFFNQEKTEQSCKQLEVKQKEITYVPSKDAERLRVESTTLSSLGKLQIWFNKEFIRPKIKTKSYSEPHKRMLQSESSENLADIQDVIWLVVQQPDSDDDLRREISNYTLDEIGERNISLSITFAQTGDISKYMQNPDYLDIIFANPKLFIDTEKGIELDRGETNFEIKLQKQFTQEEFDYLMQTQAILETASIGVSIWEIIACFFFQKSLGQMWILLNTVQFIIYMGIWQIDLPSVTRIAFDQLKKVVLGEFLDDLQIGDRVSDWLGIPSENKNNSDDLVLSDPNEQKSIYQNLGVTLIIGTAVFLLIITLILIFVFACRKRDIQPKNKQRLVKLRKSVLYNPIIRYAYLNSLKLNLTALSAFKQAKDLDAGEIAIAVVIFIIINLVPLMLATIVFKKADELEKEENVGRFGTIYEGKNVASSMDREVWKHPDGSSNDREVWKHPLTFFYRRMAFMIVTVFLADFPQIQMMAQQLLTMATIAYISHDFWMFDTLGLRFTELASEFLLLLTSVLLQQFLRIEFGDSEQKVIQILILSTIGLIIATNIGLMIWSCVQNCKKKRYLKVKREEYKIRMQNLRIFANQDLDREKKEKAARKELRRAKRQAKKEMNQSRILEDGNNDLSEIKEENENSDHSSSSDERVKGYEEDYDHYPDEHQSESQRSGSKKEQQESQAIQQEQESQQLGEPQTLLASDDNNYTNINNTTSMMAGDQTNENLLVTTVTNNNQEDNTISNHSNSHAADVVQHLNEQVAQDDQHYQANLQGQQEAKEIEQEQQPVEEPIIKDENNNKIIHISVQQLQADQDQYEVQFQKILQDAKRRTPFSGIHTKSIDQNNNQTEDDLVKEATDFINSDPSIPANSQLNQPVRAKDAHIQTI